MSRLSVLVFIIFITCGQRKEIENENGKPTQVTITFLKWYKAHYDKFNPMTLGKLIKTDTSTTFNVDTIRTREYIELLRKSGYVSIEYLYYWDNFFKKTELKYKAKTDVEFAEEFEYDYVLFTQEVEEGLAAIDNPKIISEQIKDDKSEVRITIGTNLLFHLSKADTTWHINKIENLGLNN